MQMQLELQGYDMSQMDPEMQQQLLMSMEKLFTCACAVLWSTATMLSSKADAVSSDDVSIRVASFTTLFCAFNWSEEMSSFKSKVEGHIFFQKK